MEGNTKTLNTKIIEGIIVFLSISFILCYLYVISKRLFYPFELEWLEGYFLAGMIKIVNNQSIYSSPNTEFISLLYPPFYYLLIGGLAKILGVSFWTARLVSVLSSFLSGFIIYQFVRRETKSSFCAFFTLGLFFASYQITGSWFDVARVDSLFMALSLSGIYVLRYYTKSYTGIFFAAIFLSLAFFTKQAAIFFIIGCAVYLWFTQREKCLIFTLMSTLFIFGGILLLNYLTEGWYWFHAFKVPLRHYSYRNQEYHLLLAEMYKQYTPLAQQNYGSIKKLIDFFKKDLLGNIPFLLFFVFGWLLFCLQHLLRASP
ncbi:MAG: glycosyltransferase family 39 protein [Deltaproteobacteria bacterium]|nr:glycosyltransferase family 39 protein [Deltaproteobacteria bacterium]